MGQCISMGHLALKLAVGGQAGGWRAGLKVSKNAPNLSEKDSPKKSILCWCWCELILYRAWFNISFTMFHQGVFHYFHPLILDSFHKKKGWFLQFHQRCTFVFVWLFSRWTLFHDAKLIGWIRSRASSQAGWDGVSRWAEEAVWALPVFVQAFVVSCLIFLDVFVIFCCLLLRWMSMLLLTTSDVFQISHHLELLLRCLRHQRTLEAFCSRTQLGPQNWVKTCPKGADILPFCRKVRN